MLKKPWIFIILGVLVLAFVWFWIITPPIELKMDSNETSGSVAATVKKLSAKVLGVNTSTAHTSEQDEYTSAGDVAPVSTTAELKKWIEVEGKHLEASVGNPDLKKNEIVERVKTLTPEQKNELQKIALDTTLPINSRIFAGYANSLSQVSADLYEMALSKMPTFENVQPHSADEVKRAQEYALRYMQLDELARLAVADDKSLELLRKIVIEAEDAQIRSYAERKLKEIQR